MPNHCSNNLTVSGDYAELTRFMSAITVTDPKDKENGRDYRLSQLMPMPEVLVGTQSPCPSSPDPNPNWAVMLAEGKMDKEWHDELVANQRKRYEAGQKALAETGYTDWYEWCNKNWGTKWGDYDSDLSSGDSLNPEDGDITLNYNTAWGPFSEGFFAHISKLFPTLYFYVEYEGEGMEFLGIMTAKNGEVKDFYDEVNTSDLPDPNEHWDEYMDALYERRDQIMSTLSSLA